MKDVPCRGDKEHLMYDCCVGDFSGVRFLEANEMRDPHRSPQGVIVASSGQISELDIRRFLRHFLQVVRIFSKFSVVIIYPSFLLGTFTQFHCRVIKRLVFIAV